MRKVTLYPNGTENNFLGFKSRETLWARSSYLTIADLMWIETALRLRAETCEENGEKRDAGIWRRTLRRVQKAIELTKKIKE